MVFLTIFSLPQLHASADLMDYRICSLISISGKIKLELRYILSHSPLTLYSPCFPFLLHIALYLMLNLFCKVIRAGFYVLFLWCSRKTLIPQEIQTWFKDKSTWENANSSTSRKQSRKQTHSSHERKQNTILKIRHSDFYRICLNVFFLLATFFWTTNLWDQIVFPIEGEQFRIVQTGNDFPYITL